MDKNDLTIDVITSLLKRRGFVFPSSEIYGGLAGVYDYGPHGAELAHNIKSAWWGEMVQERADIVGLNSAIFMRPEVWQASGHTGGFSDPLVECKKCNTRHRADHLLESIDIVADEKMTEEEINNIFDEHKKDIACPNCGEKDFTGVKLFNLLVSSNLGNFTNEKESEVYLRGETAQGIYVNFKAVQDSMHMKVPFGIAQIGKAFRNEITPRQYLIRTREFEQMEMQFFSAPETAMDEFEKLREFRFNALVSMGLKKENLRFKRHENLVFYAKDAYDIEYNYPGLGWRELEGIHARGDYDLTQHSKHSGQDLSYNDDVLDKKYIPHVLESSIGVGRLFLALISDAYQEEEVKGETRVVLKLNKHIAPVKVAILPLSKKDELQQGAQGVFDKLKGAYMCVYDDTQSIGKRYRRQDEIGTPFCVTYDFDSLEDFSVTVRDRDTMSQERIKIDELKEYLDNKFEK